MFSKRDAARIRQLKHSDFDVFVEELATMVDRSVARQAVDRAAGSLKFEPPEGPVVFQPGENLAPKPRLLVRQPAQEATQEAPQGIPEQPVVVEAPFPVGGSTQPPGHPLTQTLVARRAAADPFAVLPIATHPDREDRLSGLRSGIHGVTDQARRNREDYNRRFAAEFKDYGPAQLLSAIVGSDLAVPGIAPTSASQSVLSPFEPFVDELGHKFRRGQPSKTASEVSVKTPPDAQDFADQSATTVTTDIPHYETDQSELPGDYGDEPLDTTTRIIDWPNSSGWIARTGPEGIPAATSGGVAGSGFILGKGTVTVFDLGPDGGLTQRQDGATAYNLSTSSPVQPNVYIMVKQVQSLLVVDWEECPTS